MISMYRLYLTTPEHFVLLYVGITNNVPRRLTQHRRRKPWWHLVNHTHIEYLGTCRTTAARAEAEAITREGPIYNQTHNHAPGSFMSRTWSDAADDWITSYAPDDVEREAERERAGAERRTEAMVGIGDLMPLAVNGLHDRYEEAFNTGRQIATVTPIRKDTA